MNASQFQSDCRNAFRFLEDHYKCSIVQPPPDERLPEWLRGLELHYQNTTTEIIIHFEPLDAVPVIHIRRRGADRNSHSLGVLLLVKDPGLHSLTSKKAGHPLRDPTVMLELYAHALRTAGDDVLRGDFTIFPKLDEMRMALNQKRLQGG
ncbi:MAG: hypothetical protein HOP33_21885 [Verrucomicrobia bacterium]|nr:hypothetical protein [Verrucomicrobiota bacterium]